VRAIAIHQFGGPERLELIESPEPPLADDEVLLDVAAASVNPIDWRIRNGQFKDALPYEFPLILGREASGVVARVGPAVSGFAPGDRVCAFLQQRRLRWGAYGERVPVAARKLAHIPEGLDFVQAAALPVAGHTAWQGLTGMGALAAGETVLIHGAAGGVGHVAVQLARHLGARVLATASPGNHDFVRGLGAHAVADYAAPDCAAQLAAEAPDGVDVIVAPYAGPTLQGSAPLVRERTRIVLLSPDVTAADMRIGPAQAQVLIAQADGAQLAEIGALAARGVVRVEIAAVLPLAQAARAQEMSATRHTRGKIVLRVAD
jgi:NADPH:quinone reductase-like Zn-dependent oxidoreductase